MNQKGGGRDSNDEFQYSLLEINHKMSNQSIKVRKEGGWLLTFYFCLVTTYSISNTYSIPSRNKDYHDPRELCFY